MTAQNMGKKILTEAGYEVIAVSNGAAAVKKIAEQKPDIIILDVYMPGYSGLEVCEKVRASLETAKTPVLLTVGKMEPHKPEDANRVKADGVIIKPFEASDLLAIIKKFEERLGPVTPAPLVVEQTVLLERRFVENALAGAAEPQLEHHPTGKTGHQPMVEVPDHMASSAAFSDLLGADASHSVDHYNVNTPAPAFETSGVPPPPPVPAAEYDLPVSWRDMDEGEPVAGIPVMVEPVVEAPPAAPEPKTEAIPVVTESTFESVPVEAEPAPDAAPMSVERFERFERFETVPVPVEPVAEPAPVTAERKVEAVPAAEGPSFETVPIMEADPMLEVAPIVEAAPVEAALVEEAPVVAEPVVEAVPEAPAIEAAPVAVEPPVDALPPPPAWATEREFAPPPPRPHVPYIPVYREPEPEPEPAPSTYEMLPTAAPPTEEIDIPREPALLESAEEATRNTVADVKEPGLIPTLQEAAPEPVVQELATRESTIQEITVQESIIHESIVDESVEYFPSAETSVMPEPAEVAPVVAPIEVEARAESSAAQEMEVSEVPAEIPVEAPPSDDLSRPPAIEVIDEGNDFDFEARVAAAMAAYNQAPATDGPTALEPPLELEPPPEEDQPAIAAEHVPARAYDRPAEPVAEASHYYREPEPPPSFEYYPPIRVPEVARAIESPVMEPVAMESSAPGPYSSVEPVPPEEMTWAASSSFSTPPEPEPVEVPQPSAHHNAAVSAGLEAALPTVVASAAEQTGTDHEMIAQVVSRVMDRLKPTLVEEILRELKSNK